MTSQEVIVAKRDILFLWQNNSTLICWIAHHWIYNTDRHICYDLILKNNVPWNKHKNRKYNSALISVMNRCVNGRGKKQWLNKLFYHKYFSAFCTKWYLSANASPWCTSKCMIRTNTVSLQMLNLELAYHSISINWSPYYLECWL